MLSQQLKNVADINSVVSMYLLNIKSRHERNMLVDAIYTKPIHRVTFLPFGCISKTDSRSMNIMQALMRLTSVHLSLSNINRYLADKHSHFVVHYITNLYETFKIGFLAYAALNPPYIPSGYLSVEYLQDMSHQIIRHLQTMSQRNCD